MSAPLRTVTALLALLAFAVPAGATVVQALVDCCEGPCPEHASAPHHAPGHTPDHSPSSPEEAPAPDVDGAVCCFVPAAPVSDTPVVVPAPERSPELAWVPVPVAVVPAEPPRTLEAPARPPPLPAVRPHLVFLVLLI